MKSPCLASIFALLIAIPLLVGSNPALCAAGEREIDPEILLVPTFECIGIYRGAIGDSTVTCDVYYRETGTPDWLRAQALWYDQRDEGYVFHAPAEAEVGIPLQDSYRGSIVGLLPGSEYEIELRFGTGEIKYAVASTWPDSFETDGAPVIVEDRTELLEITEGGAPGAYKLYTHPEGQPTAYIDLLDEVNQENPDGPCIRIDASYVIIDGLTLIGGRYGIVIAQGSTDVVIQGCDISGWGQPSVDYPYLGSDGIGGTEAGIQVDKEPGDPNDGHLATKRLVIQGNRIHDPLLDTNYWGEYPGFGHPIGPQAIRLRSVGGNNVVRFNDFYGSEEHYFDDIIGGASNFSYNGCPGPDTDIYGNSFSHCWDDAIEAEGGGRNVRIWGNYMNETYTGVALATVSVGPVYIWRNVMGVSRYRGVPGGSDPNDLNWAGRFVKLGQGCDNLTLPWPLSCTEFYGDGKVYIYHNTALQPRYDGNEQTDNGYGVDGGVENTNDGGDGYGSSDRGPVYNIVAVNNILNAHRYVVCTYEASEFHGHAHGLTNFYTKNIWRHDAPNSVCYQDQEYVETEYDGFANFDDGDYNPLTGTGTFGQFWLDSTDELGLDNAAPLWNFNDAYVNPDIGAHERGTDLMAFGALVWESRYGDDPGRWNTALPVRYAIVGSHPNPFNPRTELRIAVYQVADERMDALPLELEIYDVIGRRIRTLPLGPLSLGERSVEWDGRNADGRPMSSGVYFASLRIAGQTRTHKLVLIR